MILIFRTMDGTLLERSEIEDGSWVHVTDPSDDEKRFLTERFGLSADDIEDALDIDAEAAVWRTNGYTAVILLCSSESHTEGSIPYITVPLAIFLTESAVVTLCTSEPAVIEDLLLSNLSSVSTPEREKLLLTIMLRSAYIFRRQIREIREKSSIDKEIVKHSITGKKIISILNHGESLIYFASALQSNQGMLDDFRKIGELHPGEEEEGLLEDVIVQNRQNVRAANTTTEVHRTMLEGVSSIVSLNLNQLVKVLTEITIALTIPAIIGAAWGMNVDLPLKDLPFTFWILIGLMAGTALAAFLLLRTGEVINPTRWRR